jgi:hypothetical protein
LNWIWIRLWIGRGRAGVARWMYHMYDDVT